MERTIINDVVASIEKCKLHVALDKKTVDSLQEKIQFRFVDEGKKSIGFELKERPESKFSALVEFFNVGDDERLVFEGQFLSAISGSGSELKNITTFSSSALLSLMCFRNVAGKVLKIKEINPKGWRGITFPTMLEALTYKEVFTKENPSFLDASVKSFYRL